MRVVFYQLSDSGESAIPAVNCTDFFADEVDKTRAFFAEEQNVDNQWFCPDTAQIDLLN